MTLKELTLPVDEIDFLLHTEEVLEAARKQLTCLVCGDLLTEMVYHDPDLENLGIRVGKECAQQHTVPVVINSDDITYYDTIDEYREKYNEMKATGKPMDNLFCTSENQKGMYHWFISDDFTGRDQIIAIVDDPYLDQLYDDVNKLYPTTRGQGSAADY